MMAAGSSPFSHVVQHPLVKQELDLGPLTPGGEITVLSDHITMIRSSGSTPTGSSPTSGPSSSSS